MARLSPIGFISRLLDGFYFGGVLAGVQQTARRYGRHVIAIQSTPEEICRTRLAFDQVCGWVVLLDVAGVAELARTGLPIVTVSTPAHDLDCPVVLPDNSGGTYAATSHLLDQGHTQIAFTGHLDNDDIKQRYEGYRRALDARGIVFRPELVFEVAGNMEDSGADAARQLLDRTPACTALVAGTDLNAIGALEYLQSQGRRIPEDIAIAGFDDIHAAQYTSPPLTTVRQRFDALGRRAAALVLEQLAGQPAPAGITYVPTELIIRRSSGAGLESVAHSSTAIWLAADPDWRALLERHLVQQATSQPLDPATSGRSVWAGAATLVRALDAVLNDQAPPPEAELERAWQEATTHTLDLQTLYRLVKLLEQAGDERAACLSDQAAARAHLERMLAQMWQMMMRARLDSEMRQAKHMAERVETNYEFAMLGSGQAGLPGSRSLLWLNKTSVRWGCLGLWQADDQHYGQHIAVAGAYCADGGSVTQRTLPTAAFPPLDALLLPEHPEDEGIIALFPVKSATCDWGVLALYGDKTNPLLNGLEHMRMWSSLLAVALDREQLVETLQTAYQRERALSDTVRELGCPVIPLLSEVVLVPLIGGIDSGRASQIVESLLHEAVRLRTRMVVVDVTGVPVVDASVADALIRAAQALKLLGVQAILTGIRPEVAQTLVGLGLDLSGITTQRDLQSGIAYALERRRLQGGKR
jgi:DNA-binding LacI/PurR family transcriptional regulator/anti-anti-sigma regulatory factor